ncbi:hypothetical protein ACWCXE_25985 [Streptomyces sp. NPDC001780]
MNNDAPTFPHPLGELTGETGARVYSLARLREHGVPAGRVAARCRPGGPWQQLLPGVYLLHAGLPTSEERLRAVLLYAGRAEPAPVPAQPSPSGADGAGGTAGQAGTAGVGAAASAGGPVMITGLAALALHGFSATPPLSSLHRIDVLVPRTRRLRSTGCARIVRARALPRPEPIGGLPVAPVVRAVADAVADLSEAGPVVTLLTEAVRGGHCEPAAVVRELHQSGLLVRPHVVAAVDTLLAEGRTLAEARLYEMVRAHGLPEPLWNVDLRLPGGPGLGAVDAYWPEQAVAVELDTRAPHPGVHSRTESQAGPDDEEARWSATARKREHLERLGITVVHLTPAKLRESPEQQATVVRTALTAAEDRDPAAYVTVLPR